jgi:predicted RNA-binding protein with PUA-like domain
MQYWLFKSEPGEFSIDDLAREPRKTAGWDGIRNYQARNMIRDEMKKGDLVFFYHSSCKEPGITGVMEIVKTAYPDPTAMDPASKYYDPKSSAEDPRWFQVDVKLKRKFKRLISLTELRQQGKLKNMKLLARGNRLSILPVTAAQWQHIIKMEGQG